MQTLPPPDATSGTAAKTPSVRSARRRTGPTVGQVVAVAGVVLGLVGLTGCQRSLFNQNESRTQFESFELMRGEYRPPEEPDVFGNPQPALRARLLR